MKKTLALILSVVMLLALALPAAAAVDAQPTNDAVTVDGKTVEVAVYKINDNNYFKLRDLAQAMSGSGYQFDISFDQDAQKVDIATGKAYTAVGGELSGTAEAPKAVVESPWKLFVDGKEAGASVYNIDGNNYYKLRDLADLIGYGVGYNSYSRTAMILTKEAEAGATVAADAASPTGYTITFVLNDDGYESVVINGNFTFVPVLTEDSDWDFEWIPQMDENGMAIKNEKGKSVVELGRDMSAEKDNIKANTVAVDDGLLPVVVDAYNWSKSYTYDDPSTEAVENVVTSLDHWTKKIDYTMTKVGSQWIISMPLPSGNYTYTYKVTKGGETKTINDPANVEQWWGTKVVPSKTDPGFEDSNDGYRQAFAKLDKSYTSVAYVPFDAEKQVWDWSYIQPVSEKQYEGTVLVDVPYPQRNDIINPEVAQAYKDGLSEDDGHVDFIRTNEKGENEGLLCIYLPAGYDPDRADPYKVVYKSHGGRGCQSVDTDTIRIADNLMASEGWDHSNDFLIVTFNCYASSTNKAWPSWFDWKVLSNITENIIPFIEANYNVGKTEADRAICGYSAGGAVAHYSLLYYSDWFDYFGPWGCGESTTIPGDFNAYVKYIKSYEQYVDSGLQDEHVLLASGFYDVARAGGYTVYGTKDAVQTIRYDHLYRGYMGLRDIVGIKDMAWFNGHGNHDNITGNAACYLFFRDYLWK